MIIYYSKLNNVREISNTLNISLGCAEIARENFEKWIYSVKAMV